LNEAAEQALAKAIKDAMRRFRNPEDFTTYGMAVKILGKVVALLEEDKRWVKDENHGKKNKPVSLVKRKMPDVYVINYRLKNSAIK
jgi:hypothetical protein